MEVTVLVTSEDRTTNYDGVPTMRRFSHSSLRTRLIVTVVLLMLPLLVLIWHGTQRQFERESVILEQEVQRLTAFIGGDVNQLLEATRQILVVVTETCRTTDPETGRTVLAGLSRQCPYYTGSGVVSIGGETNGLDVYAKRMLELINTQLVQRAAATKGLVVGDFRANSGDGRNVLSVAYCSQEGRMGSPPMVAFVVLDLGWLDSLLSEERVTGEKSLFPEDTILNILDRSGTVLTRYPDKEKWTGKRLPDTEVLEEILRSGEGAADLTGVDGMRRFYAFQSVKVATGDIFVCIGVSRDTALAAARSDMRNSLVGVSIVGIVLVLVAWFGVGALVTRPLNSLVDATERLGAGDLNARAGVARGPGEILHLAGTFDHMAETLQRDTHERERMQLRLVEYDRQLRSMSVEAVLAEERERKQIAAGIHDKVGPLLATCYMKLGRALKQSAPQGVVVAMNESRELIDQTIGEVRSLTFDLSSSILYTIGLTAAVEELCTDIEKHHSLQTTFQDQGTPGDLSNEQRVVLYRAVRELLFNTVKHAEASRITVTCGGDVEEVFVSVVDDGVGFDATDAGRGFSRTGGFGLFSLRERVTHLGGRFVVESSRGTGTRVLVTLPVCICDRREDDGNDNQGTPG